MQPQPLASKHHNSANRLYGTMIAVKVRQVSIILMGTFLGAALGQTPPSDPGPVQAEFLTNLDVRHLVSGNTAYARVTQDWNGQGCVLEKGAVLEGTVEESLPRAAKSESKLALSFKRAQCNGQDLRPMDLVLTVIAQVPADWAKVPNTQSFLTMRIPAGILSGPSQPIGMFKLTEQTLTQLQLSAIEHRFPVRKDIRPGDVLNIKGLHLDLGTGPNRSSVISSGSRNVFLAEFTQILLVPPGRAFRSPSANAAIGAAGDASVRRSSIPKPALPEPKNIETCAPPGCAVDLPVTAQELMGQSTSSIETRAFGYARRANRILTSFDDEESLAWLGPGQLLFAFNPHQPILRKRGDQSVSTRIARAVLLDTSTRKVIRAVDWEISDSHRYLWQLDGDRVLVHVGNELRVYRAGMEVERRVPLAGPLAFVRIAPSGGLLAVATLRERHSAELHARLRNELGKEPEEDVDVAILNESFNTVAQVSTLSNLMAPTLLDEGQVRLQAEPGQWYRLAMSTWENQRSALVRFHSFCMPDVSSIAPDLLFLVTCNAPEGDINYSVLSHDGKLLLRGASNPHELGHEAIGNRSSRRFAMKIVHSDRSIFPGTNFRNSELDAQEVRVYRAEDGKRLLAVRVKDPAASRGGYALSPDGSELAVLSGSEIQFFHVSAE